MIHVFENFHNSLYGMYKFYFIFWAFQAISQVLDHEPSYIHCDPYITWRLYSTIIPSSMMIETGNWNSLGFDAASKNSLVSFKHALCK